jgi:hypothetical protein
VPRCSQKDLPENLFSFSAGCCWGAAGNMIFNLCDETFPVSKRKVGVSTAGPGGEVNGTERDGYGKMVGVELVMGGPG